MTLTRGQKDALMRKALEIVNKKRAEKRADLVAHWKPNHIQKAALDTVKTIQELSTKLYKALESAGFTKEYCSWHKQVDGHDFKISVYNLYDGVTDIYEMAEKELMNECVEAELQKVAVYPDDLAITDEIELLNISKDFNVDEFLARYNAL